MASEAQTLRKPQEHEVMVESRMSCLDVADGTLIYHQPLQASPGGPCDTVTGASGLKLGLCGRTPEVGLSPPHASSLAGYLAGPQSSHLQNARNDSWFLAG